MIRTTTVATVVALGAIAGTSLVGTAPAAAAPFAPVPTFTYTSHLEKLLLSPRQLAQVVGATKSLRLVGTSTDLIDDDSVDPPSCAGAFEPGHRSAYAAAGPTTSVSAVAADGKPGRALHFVNQTVLSVADSQSAAKQLRSSARTWSSCAAQPITVKRKSGAADRWQLDAAELRRDDTVLVQRQSGAKGSCERAMTTAAGEGGAVIVDVTACALRGGDPAGRAEQIAAAIAANLGGAG